MELGIYLLRIELPLWGKPWGRKKSQKKEKGDQAESHPARARASQLN